MPKTSHGTINVAQLKKCKTIFERKIFVRYGRAMITKGGQLVAVWKMFNRSMPDKSLLEKLLPDMKALPGFAHRISEAEKDIAEGRKFHNTTHEQQKTKKQLEAWRKAQDFLSQEYGKEFQNALIRGDAYFFECVAEAIRAMQSTEPVDPVRTTLLDIALDFTDLFSDEKTDYKDLLNANEIEVPLFWNDILTLLHRRLPNRKRENYDLRELRRWCAELGIHPLKEKRGRRKGSRSSRA